MLNKAEVCSTHQGLVYHIAKQYIGVCAYDRALDIKDLAQSGYIGLIQAVQTYDECKGAFSTWAGVYIKMEMQKALGLSRRDRRADQGAASLDEMLLGAEDITLQEALEAPDDTEGEYDHAELVQGVKEIVATLADPQRTLVQQHDLQGIGLSAAGRSCVIVSLLSWLYYRYKSLRLMQDTLSCLRPTVVALIASAGLRYSGWWCSAAVQRL